MGIRSWGMLDQEGHARAKSTQLRRGFDGAASSALGEAKATERDVPSSRFTQHQSMSQWFLTELEVKEMLAMPLRSTQVFGDTL